MRLLTLLLVLVAACHAFFTNPIADIVGKAVDTAVKFKEIDANILISQQQAITTSFDFITASNEGIVQAITAICTGVKEFMEGYRASQTEKMKIIVDALHNMTNLYKLFAETSHASLQTYHTNCKQKAAGFYGLLQEASKHRLMGNLSQEDYLVFQKDVREDIKLINADCEHDFNLYLNITAIDKKVLDDNVKFYQNQIEGILQESNAMEKQAFQVIQDTSNVVDAFLLDKGIANILQLHVASHLTGKEIKTTDFMKVVEASKEYIEGIPNRLTPDSGHKNPEEL